MNSTTVIMTALGLLIFWLTLVKPRVALFLFVFSLMAFNDYLGGHPSSIMDLGGNLFYAADFFLILLVGGLIRGILRGNVGSHIDKPILIMMLLSVLMGIVAILIGFDNGHKSNVIIGDFRRYSYYPWAIFIPALFLNNNRDIRALEKVAFVAATVICAIAAYRVITWSSYWPEQHAVEYGYFRAMSYHDYLILIFVTCIGIGNVLDSKERPSLLIKVGLAVLPIFIIASNYRLALLLLFACSSLVFFILRRARWGRSQMTLMRTMKLALLGILLVVVVGFTGAMTGNKTYLQVEKSIAERVVQFDWSRQESYRGEMWKELIKEWKASPLMGVGFGRTFYYEMRTREGKWYWAFSENFHNCYLGLLLKEGILGLIIFLSLLFVILARCVIAIRIRRDVTPLVAAGIAFMIAVLVTAAMQPVLEDPNSIVISYLIIGSVISVRFTHTPLEGSITKRREYLCEGVLTTEI